MFMDDDEARVRYVESMACKRADYIAYEGLVCDCGSFFNSPDEWAYHVKESLEFYAKKWVDMQGGGGS